MVIVVISFRWDNKVLARSGATTKENSMQRGEKPKKMQKEKPNRSCELEAEVATMAEIEIALEAAVEIDL